MTKKAKRKSSPGARSRRLGADEYDVGYAKPPRDYQFKPGQSGYPPGRRKGAKNEETILRELLQQKVRITENGKVRKITLHEAILRRIAEDSLRGNIKSVGFLLNRYYAAVAGGVAQADLSEDDKAVLDAYLRKLKDQPEDDGGEGQP
jgi:hypothetical protein